MRNKWNKPENIFNQTVIPNPINEEEIKLMESNLISSQNLNKDYSIRLSIIILCYNNLNYTKQCIESVHKNTKTLSYEIIVVNNNSTDGTKEYLDKLNYIKVIHNNDNLGFSKGMNIGVKNALGQYIILLNNDSVVYDKWDIFMLDELEYNSNIFCVMPITNCANCEAMISINHNTPDDFFKKYNELKTKLCSRFLSKYLVLFCAAFRHEEFISIGYLDEGYLNGYEDDDLNKRIKLIDKKVVVSTQSIVYHFGSITLGEYYNKNNKIYFEQKWNKPYNKKFILKIRNNIEKKYIEQNYSQYYFDNNYSLSLKHYLQYYLNLYSKNENFNNNFLSIDINIYNYLNYVKNNNIYKDIYENGIENGKIYSVKQIRNLLNITDFYSCNNNYFGKINDNYVDLKLIANKLYSQDFNYFITNIEIIENTLNNYNNNAICSYIGNESIGLKLLDKILNSDKRELTQIIIFNKKIDITMFKELLNKFSQKIIFRSNEYGNDIIPTLQAIYYMRTYNLNFIIKLHTKSNEKIFNEYTDYLLNKSILELEGLLITSPSNCVGKTYSNINEQKFHCKSILEKYKEKFHKNDYVPYTIFFANINIFETVLNFIENNNFKSYFMNNLYDLNVILLDNSPIHFLERLFGIINCD